MRPVKFWDVNWKTKEKENFRTGNFHQFGQEYEEFETNAGNTTIAIIETEDGMLHSVLIQNLQFLDKLPVIKEK